MSPCVMILFPSASVAAISDIKLDTEYSAASGACDANTKFVVTVNKASAATLPDAMEIASIPGTTSAVIPAVSPSELTSIVKVASTCSCSSPCPLATESDNPSTCSSPCPLATESDNPSDCSIGVTCGTPTIRSPFASRNVTIDSMSATTDAIAEPGVPVPVITVTPSSTPASRAAAVTSDSSANRSGVPVSGISAPATGAFSKNEASDCAFWKSVSAEV